MEIEFIEKQAALDIVNDHRGSGGRMRWLNTLLNRK
jgi:hypothetical protein